MLLMWMSEDSGKGNKMSSLKLEFVGLESHMFRKDDLFLERLEFQHSISEVWPWRTDV